MLRRVPLIGAIAGTLVTLLSFYRFAIAGESLPFPAEPVLGIAELFGWLVVYGDNDNRRQILTAGLPVGLAFNATVGYLLGVVFSWGYRRLMGADS